MLTTLLLLSISTAPMTASHACESASVERPGLSLPAPEWGFIVRPETACSESRSTAALMYSVGIDAAVPVEGEELDADIYITEE